MRNRKEALAHPWYTAPLREVLAAHTDKTKHGCWLWTGAIRKTNGYGQLAHYNKKKRKVVQLYAHRVAYKLAKGKIPKGFFIDHLCFVRHCINPEHLEAVGATESGKRKQPSLVVGQCDHGRPIVVRCMYC